MSCLDKIKKWVNSSSDGDDAELKYKLIIAAIKSYFFGLIVFNYNESKCYNFSKIHFSKIQLLNMKNDIIDLIENSMNKKDYNRQEDIIMKKPELLKEHIINYIDSYICDQRFCDCKKAGDHLAILQLCKIKIDICNIIDEYKNGL